jgi:hypothetical protein
MIPPVVWTISMQNKSSWQIKLLMQSRKTEIHIVQISNKEFFINNIKPFYVSTSLLEKRFVCDTQKEWLLSVLNHDTWQNMWKHISYYAYFSDILETTDLIEISCVRFRTSYEFLLIWSSKGIVIIPYNFYLRENIYMKVKYS